MKTIFAITLSILAFCSISAQAQQSDISKKEAKKIAGDINNTLDKLSTSIDSVDWNAFGNLLGKALESIDKKADALTEIAKNIDMDKVNINLEKMGAQIEKSVDMKKLEKQLEELGVQIEKALPDSKK